MFAAYAYDVDAHDVDDVAVATREAQGQLVRFGQGLSDFVASYQSCYTNYDNHHTLCQQLLSGISRNIVLFRELHLPASQQLVHNLGDFMTNYSQLAFEDFMETLPEIVDDALRYRDHAKLVSRLYHEFREDAANLQESGCSAVKQLELEQRDSTTEEHRLRSKSSRHFKKRDFATSAAIGIATVAAVAAPFTGGASLALLAPALGATAVADHHRVKEAYTINRIEANTENRRNAHMAAQAIAGPMADCINQLLDAISVLCQFFATVHTHAQDFAEQAERAERIGQGKSMEALKRLVKRHFLKMKGPAKELKQMCDKFSSIAPSIDGDLKRLTAKDGTHRSYIQAWLETKEEQLELAKVMGNDEKSSGWLVCQEFCSAVIPKVYNVWLDYRMDNRSGAGKIKLDIRLEDAVSTATSVLQEQVHTQQRQRFAGLKISASLPVFGINVGVEGTGNAKHMAESIAHLKHLVEHSTQQLRNRTITLEAKAGMACTYRVTLSVRPGDVGMSVRAMPMRNEGSSNWGN